jgi:nicotinamidase/pyrazinamidase
MLNVLFGVDPQRGFCPKRRALAGTGELSVSDGDKIMVPALALFEVIEDNEDEGWLIGLSGDWHSSDNKAHFKRHGRHCVANTPGARFHPYIERIAEGADVFYKGTGNKGHDYSALRGRRYSYGETFGGTEVESMEKFDDFYSGKGHRRNQIVFYIWGLATDYCVLETVLELLNLGYRVVLLTDAIRAVNKKAGKAAIKKMVAAGAVCKTTKDIIGGYRLAA